MMSWPFGIGLHVLEVLGHGLAGDGQAVAVEQPRVEEHLHQRHGAADLDQLGHDVLAAGLEVGQHGHALLADAGEVVEASLTPAAWPWRAGAARRWWSRRAHDHGDGVLEGLLRHDVAGRMPA
jgi:hypothetical protein